eukprot:COSAG01_NODE_14098_length_1496_cov_1.325698_1_plen_34_part_01
MELLRLIHPHPSPKTQPLFLYAPYEAVHGASSCF